VTIKPIKTEEDYNAAVAEIESLFELDKSAEGYDRLDVLATLVEAYESKHYPIGPPDPIAAIEYELEKRGLSRRSLEPIIGPSGRVSEVLNRQIPLTMTMIRKLHSQLGISGDILLNEYPISKPRKLKRDAPTIALERVDALF
jgi:HTH-type transcriptional regulator/antitoxin HigA